MIPNEINKYEIKHVFEMQKFEHSMKENKIQKILSNGQLTQNDLNHIDCIIKKKRFIQFNTKRFKSY
jgi:hypothetical protein